MSTVDQNHDSRTFLLEAVPLLLEYEKKMRSVSSRARKLMAEIEEASGWGGAKQDVPILRCDADQLHSLFNDLSPIVINLAQHVSQQIEHGNLDDMARIELSLRLAEFENTHKHTTMKMDMIYNRIRELTRS